MSAKSKTRDLSSDSESEEEEEVVRKPAAKKSKTENKKKASSSKSEENMFEIGRMRYVNVSEFRGKVLVSIREYYEADGDLRPGKKGISLTVEQFKTLKDKMDDISEAIENF